MNLNSCIFIPGACFNYWAQNNTKTNYGQLLISRNGLGTRSKPEVKKKYHLTNRYY